MYIWRVGRKHSKYKITNRTQLAKNQEKMNTDKT